MVKGSSTGRHQKELFSLWCILNFSWGVFSRSKNWSFNSTHHSQQHASPQLAVLRLQQELTKPKARFEPKKFTMTRCICYPTSSKMFWIWSLRCAQTTGVLGESIFAIGGSKMIRFDEDRLRGSSMNFRRSPKLY